MFKLKLLVFFFFVSGCLQHAFGQQLIDFKGTFEPLGNKVEILTDTNASLSLNQAIQSDGFKKSVSEYPNLGITPYAYWIKFTVRNSSSHNGLGIQLAQPTIDNVDFYQIDGDKVILANSSGQSKPFGTRLIRHQNYIYPVNVLPGQSSTFYFHIRSYKQLVLPLYLGTLEGVIINTANSDLLFGVYAGIILVMLLYNLFVYVTVKDVNYLYYVLYLFVVLLTQACLEGYIFRFVLSDRPVAANLSIYVSSALIGIAAIEFAKKFLSSKFYAPGLHKISYVFFLVYAIQIVLAFAGRFNTSYTIVLVAAMLSAIYVVIMAVVIAVRGYRAAKFFLIAWSVFIVCVVIYVLKDLNILFPYNKLTSSVLLIGSAFEAVLLSFALADKINIFKAEKEKSQEEALKALKENERIISEQNTMLEAKVVERTTELKQSNLELNKTLDNLRQAQGQLVEAEKMASLGQLTAGIAHEINNPINFVTGNIKPLSRDIDMVFEAMETIEQVALSDVGKDDKQKQISAYKEDLDFDYLVVEIKHLLKGIKEGANRTAEIVKGLRIFSRLDQDDLIKADINEGLESTLIIANNLLHDIKVVKEYGNLPKIECYAGKLNQVFLNLISNASYAIRQKFGDHKGGELLIKTTCHDEHMYITIKDNGIGMDDKTQKKVFEPFFTTKDVGQGTGLGMSIAYNTIKKHNGQFQLNSAPDEGAEFIIVLPLIFKIEN
ncbi:7TM diverse intracellular signaling domain-containing protein [Mucilaginibacter sp. CSA2-8R]|uniref:sensor histidine kinase n=1 Tax=Mucilaginibacter sp. CSA2-8R TaxID=3141542 RepID=UPI00315DB978